MRRDVVASTQVPSLFYSSRGCYPAREFLEKSQEILHDPFLLNGMDLAVNRIIRALSEKERITIYGDYDVDGVTSSTVLRTALLDFGIKEVDVILPNRFTDGYGMKDSAIEKIQASGASLVITVDNGSGSGDTIEKLKDLGIETIVTDHHEIPHKPKAAITVINPHLPGEKYGLRMAGVGVAFTLARALNMRKNGGACEDRRIPA